MDLEDLFRKIVSEYSNERLEQEIASFYWEAVGFVREVGELGILWEEFDARAREGKI